MAKLFLCILILTYCWTVSVAQIPIDCCLSAKNTTIENRYVADYRRQTAGRGCFIDAAIFVTRHGKKLCLSPDAPCVEGLIRHVKHIKKICKQTKYKSRRCFGVKPE